MQFYHLCRVLLALHYPIQSTGINLLRFMRYIEVCMLITWSLQRPSHFYLSML